MVAAKTKNMNLLPKETSPYLYCKIQQSGSMEILKC
jgi:hypothetical protein